MRTVGLVDITTRTDTFNNSRQRQLSTAAAAEPSSRASNMAAHSAATARRKVSRHRRRAASSAANCFTGRAIFLHRPLSADHRGNRKSAADAQRHPRFLAAGKRLRLYVDVRRPVDAAQPDRRNRHQQVPNSQRARSAGRPERKPPVTSAFGVTISIQRCSTRTRYEFTQYGVLALQRSVNGFDGQLSYFTRYNNLHFMPDPVGDLLFNGIASDISRQVLHQRHPGRRLLRDQRGAHAAHRLHRQRRTDLGRQYVARRAVHRLRRYRHRRAGYDHRRRRKARLARRRLCPGRVENHRTS